MNELEPILLTVRGHGFPVPPGVRPLGLTWRDGEWHFDACPDCVFHPHDDNGTHLGLAHIHYCEAHGAHLITESERANTAEARVETAESVARSLAAQVSTLLGAGVPDAIRVEANAAARVEELKTQVRNLREALQMITARHPDPVDDADHPAVRIAREALAAVEQEKQSVYCFGCGFEHRQDYKECVWLKEI